MYIQGNLPDNFLSMTHEQQAQALSEQKSERAQPETLSAAASIIGGAFIGSVIAGPAGAIVGALVGKAKHEESLLAAL